MMVRWMCCFHSIRPKKITVSFEEATDFYGSEIQITEQNPFRLSFLPNAET